MPITTLGRFWSRAVEGGSDYRASRDKHRWGGRPERIYGLTLCQFQSSVWPVSHFLAPLLLQKSYCRSALRMYPSPVGGTTIRLRPHVTTNEDWKQRALSLRFAQEV